MLRRPIVIANSAKLNQRRKRKVSRMNAFLFLAPRKNIATLEHRIKRADVSQRRTDLLRQGTLPVENKSIGKYLSVARKQAQEYINGLKPADNRFLTLSPVVTPTLSRPALMRLLGHIQFVMSQNNSIQSRTLFPYQNSMGYRSHYHRVADHHYLCKTIDALRYRLSLLSASQK